MDLNDLLNYLGEAKSQRNGVINPTTYVPTSTSFEAYSDPKSDLDGYVRFLADHNVAHINTEMNEATLPAYVGFHEAAHTAQPALDVLLGMVGQGPYKPLMNNKFPEYPSKGGVPPPYEALATLRGMEAMMPPGTTIWDLEHMYDDGSGRTAANYRNETLRNNPRMTPAGAERLIDLRMFPEHQLMHDPGKERLKPFNPSLLHMMLNLFKK